MASSGSFNTTGYEFSGGTTRYLTFSWEVVSQSTQDNTTTISWKLFGAGTYQYNPVCSDFHVEIDGDVVYDKPSTYHLNVYPDDVVASGKKVITHNSDGKRSFKVYVEAGIYVHAANCSGSGEWDLPTIARASTISSASDVTLGNKCSVKWEPKSTSFRYRLEFSMGNWSYKTDAIHPNTTSAYTYTGYPIPIEAAEQIPNASTGTMTVKLYTYSDSDGTKQVGGASTASFTVTVPDSSDTKPIVSMTLAPVSSLAAAFDGLYIQGKTKVKATMGGSGKYGATIKTYSIKVEGASYDSGDSYTSGYLAGYGNIEVYGYAKDSRGYTGSITLTIPVIGYANPKILAVSGENNVVAGRCDSDGNLIDSGTYLKVKAKRSYSSVASGGKQYNFCKIQYRYKLASAASYSSWETILPGESLSSDEIITGALLGGVLAVDSSYLVQVQSIDDVGECSITTISVPTDKVYMHRDVRKRSLAFGKYIEEENCIDIAEDIKVRIRGEFITDSTASLASRATNVATFAANADETAENADEPAAYVAESGTSGGWTYKKWSDGTYVMFGTFSLTPAESAKNEILYLTNSMEIAVPFTISSAYVAGSMAGHYWIANCGISGSSAITLQLMSDKIFSTTNAIEVRLTVHGEWK